MKEKDAQGTQFKPLVLPDAGLQPARCYAIIDLGSHLSVFKGQPVMNQKTGKQVITDKIAIYWELPKFMNVPEDGHKPFPATVKNEYTWSADPKSKLPEVLKSWGPMKDRPEKLNEALLKKFLGHICMLNIEHADSVDKKTQKKRTFANISGGGRGVNPWMKELTPPVKHNELIFFSIDKFTWETFYKLPKYAQDMIRKSIGFGEILAKMPEPIKTDAAAEFTDLSEEADFGGIEVGDPSDSDKF